jgi:hypothetical protein
MIEKDAGSPRINRLRIIHLFEADLNFVLSCYGDTAGPPLIILSSQLRPPRFSPGTPAMELVDAQPNLK